MNMNQKKVVPCGTSASHFQQRAWLLLLLCVALASTARSQTPAEFRKAADVAYHNSQWAEALTNYAQYQEVKPGEAEVLTRLGICHYQLRQGEKAQQFLEFVLGKNPESKDADLFYYLGRTLHGNGEYERAIAAYKSYLRVASEKHPYRANATDNIRRCATATFLTDNPNVALVENLGDRINSTGDEFAPVLSPMRSNRLYFAAAKAGSVGGRRDDKGYENETTGHYCADMYFADQGNSGWDYASPLNSLLNTSRHEVGLGFSPNGQILYFFRGFTLYSGDVYADTSGSKDEYALTPPTFQGPMQPEQGDVSATFIGNNAVLFASRRAGGFGGLDLYYSTRLTDGGWTIPQNLGPEINSPYDETTPFLSRNGLVLYFSSNRTESIGGLDVFRAVYNLEQQRFDAPVNVGAPINSPFDDAYFQLAADGNAAYLSSDRFGSLGQRDLYIAYFLSTQEEQSTDDAPFFIAGAKAAISPAGGGQVDIPQMTYTDDRDVLKKENVAVVEQVAELARRYPDAVVQVQAHTHESGPAKFDLYYGIKRAELVGKSLAERGVEPGRIELLSAGPFYPQALNALNGQPNPTGQAFNRRINCRLLFPNDPPPVKTTNTPAAIPEIMYAAAEKQFSDKNAGLTYKVEVAVSRQLLNNDALGMFNDQHIESISGSNEYHYTLGWTRTYADALALRKELQTLGFPEAKVMPYRHGRRITRAEAVKYLKQYPDLAAFLRG
jgi:outer membrane protein OmpA-like peptidoglycan-associated protein